MKRSRTHLLNLTVALALTAAAVDAKAPKVTPYPPGDTPPKLTPFDCSSPSDYVQTTSGPVCGGIPEDFKMLNAYWGIPYAQTTAGAGRWQPPKAIDPTTTIRHKADRFGDWCPQVKGIPAKDYIGSEDCLTLNIWTPSLDLTDSYPVMVYIHGGAFIQGASWVPTEYGNNLYDGGSLSWSQKVVVVSLNYRLGAMGFLGGQDGYQGNAGFLDQQLALKWVQQNIDRFGGDPTQVTIFGESAGGMSVALHMLSAPSSYEPQTVTVHGEKKKVNLFRAGILESNPAGLPYKSLEEAGDDFTSYQKEVCKLLGVQPKDCGVNHLQTADLGILLEAQGKLKTDPPAGALEDFLTWTPVVDGTVIVRQPLDGKFHQPAILGTNENEGILFAYGLWTAESILNSTCRGVTRKDTTECYKDIVAKLLPKHAKKVEQLYPSGSRFVSVQQLAKMITDYTFTCSNQALAQTAGKGRDDLFAYRFLQTSSPGHFYIDAQPQHCGVRLGRHAAELLYCECWSKTTWDHPTSKDAVCHGAELPYVFNSPGFAAHAFDQDQKTLSANLQTMWAAFAKDPSTAPHKGWDAFSSKQQHVELEGAGPSYGMASVSSDANCDFWINTVGFDPETSAPLARFLNGPGDE